MTKRESRKQRSNLPAMQRSLWRLIRFFLTMFHNFSNYILIFS
ncbi:hypothetical protein [Porphyromonas pogonae]|nr:hypothetical protein [Porphyromonas pogonae]